MRSQESDEDPLSQCTQSSEANASSKRGRDSPQSLPDTSQSSQTSYQPSQDIVSSECLSDGDVDVHEVVKNDLMQRSLSVTMDLMDNDMLAYMGIEQHKYFIIESLKKKFISKNAKRDIYLTLRKIRLNESFHLLGKYFGITACRAGQIFSMVLPILSQNLGQLVFRPDKETILRNLPVAFRANFSDVTHILDCFEIGIQRPANALHQLVTFSRYKGGNTLKFAVCSTPDCHITEISPGYGGRTSDVALIRDWGILDNLPPGMTFLADRGFKHLEVELEDRGCSLVRPPSVGEGQVLSELETLKARQIASVRIQIERVIGRLRRFQIINIHASVDNKFIGDIDKCVLVAAGLVNLQSKLIGH